jgi:uncharacterized Zn finger protein (UPF0148 family)
MSMIVCPNCKMQVIPKPDGTCPSCQFKLDQEETGLTAGTGRPGNGPAGNKSIEPTPAPVSGTKTASRTDPGNEISGGPRPARAVVMTDLATGPGRERFLGLKCPDCGGAISEKDVLCPHCGANLDEPIPMEQVTPELFKSFRKHSYAITPNGEKRLLITWKGVWNQVTIFFDNKMIGAITDKRALMAGKEFLLPDGSKLKVRLDRQSGLNVLRDGKALPGSASDPEAKFKGAHQVACGFVYWIGGLTLVLGLANSLFNLSILGSKANGAFQIAAGFIFLALGYLAQRKWRPALMLAIGLYALDGIVSLFLLTAQGSFLAISVLIAHIIFIIPMIRGVSAMYELKYMERIKRV